MRRLLSVGLAVATVFGFVPVMALATPEQNEPEDTALIESAPALATADLDSPLNTFDVPAADDQASAEASTVLPEDTSLAAEPEGDPVAPEPDPEPVPTPAVVKTSVSPDEKVVTVTASGGAFADAKQVTFDTWSQLGGKDDFVRHGAIRNADGSWTAKIFIAANPPVTPGVPYNGRIPSAVHRLYNAYNGEHLYTADTHEADTLTWSGWTYEGVAWVTPDPTMASTAVPSLADELPTTISDDVLAPGADGDTTLPDGDGVESDGTESNGTENGGTENQGPDEGTNGSGDQDVVNPNTPADPETPANPNTPADPNTPVNPAPPADTRPAAQDVYRLYNPSTGEHLYTMDANEYLVLPNYGWQPEGVKLTSDPNHGVPIYRLHNPALTAGNHLYTVDSNEYYTLPSQGWNQEDVAFYGAEFNADGSWSASGRATPHAAPGTYTVEAYGTTNTSTTARPTLMGATTFKISYPQGTVAVDRVDNAKGTFDVVVSGVSSVSGVANVMVPTWSAWDQSDVRWAEAQPQGDGTYRVTVSATDYGLAKDYTSHAYVTGTNGVQANIGELLTTLTLENYMSTAGGPYNYWIGIYNPGAVNEVTMGVWSLDNGQDDLHWYQAEPQGDGWWAISMKTWNLKSGGTLQVDAFADQVYRNTITMNVEPWEILEQKYVNMNQRVDALASPTNYLIAVDTGRCFVGIYTGYRGHWENIAFWPCAPGTAWTPTVTGLFSVGSRGYSFGSGYTCYYWTQFYNDYLFHSIKYNEGTFTVQDGTMGAPASHGCVRLWLGNARWIYNNIPSGTTVLSY